MAAGSGLAVTQNGETNPAKGNSRSWFLLLQEFGKYNAYIMTIIADDDYLKGDLTKLDGNKYNKRDSDFSGMVIYTTPTGQLVNGWGYKNGVIISQMPGGDAAAVNATNSKTTQAVKTNKIESTTVCVVWFQTSTYVNAAGKTITSEPTYLDTKCTTVYNDTGSGGGGSSNGGTSAGSGGGTGGSGSPATTPATTPVPQDCVPVAAAAVKDKTRVNGLQVQVVQPGATPVDGGGGFPPPSGKVPCPTAAPVTIINTITNNITDDPCLRNKVNAAVAKDITYNLDESMVSIFNSNTNFNLSYFDAPSTYFPSAADDGLTQVDNARSQTISGRLVINSLDIRITLNQPQLRNASQEYVTATIMHEAFHAYLNYSNTIVNQHLDMARNYLSNMASQLRAMYPNLSQADANALTWGGLETDALALYSGMPQADKNNIEITNKNYKSGKSGTPCQ